MRITFSGKFSRFAMLALAPAVILAAGCGSGNSSPGIGGASGVVYTENNDVAPGANKILAFRRDSSGNLTPIGSFAANGTGVSEPALTASGTLDTDRNLIVNPQRTLLFAVNQGSDTIAVFNILSDGTLVPITGSPFPSGGHAPVSLALINNTLVVVNSALNPQNPGSAAPNITSFTVASNGALTPVANSTITLPSGATPSIAQPSPDGKLIFDLDFHLGLIRAIQVGANGVLTQSPASPQMLDPSVYAGAPPVLLGLTIFPTTAQRLLYVSVILAKKIAVFSYDNTGALTFIRAVPNNAADPCWMRVSADGRFLYTSNALSDDISVFSLADPTNPVQIQSANITGPETIDQNNGNPWQFELDPNGQFVYDLTPRDLVEKGHAATDAIDVPTGPYDTLHVLKVNSDGTLTLLNPNSPTTLNEPPNSQPQGVASI